MAALAVMLQTSLPALARREALRRGALHAYPTAAHSLLSDDCCENTVEAVAALLQREREQGPLPHFPYLEFDVQETADGEVRRQCLSGAAAAGAGHSALCMPRCPCACLARGMEGGVWT